MRRLLPLVVIEFFVWSVLLLCTFLVANVAYSINFGNVTLTERVVTQFARNFVAGGIVLLWLLVWRWVTDSYLSEALGKQAARH